MSLKTISICIFLSSILLLLPVLFFWNSVTQYNQVEPDGKYRKGAVVLGTAVWGEEPSPALQERLNMAYDLYTKRLITYIVLTGGRGGGALSEAQAGKQYLQRRGLPENKLLLEEHSTTTIENFDHASAIIKEYNLSEVYVITHDYHMHRGLSLAHKAHLRPFPAPVHSKVLFMPYHRFRESYAIAKLRITSFLNEISR